MILVDWTARMQMQKNLKLSAQEEIIVFDQTPLHETRDGKVNTKFEQAIKLECLTVHTEIKLRS